MKLTKSEQRLLSAFKNNNFEIVPVSRKIKATYREAARATLHKNKVISLRLNEFDLDMLKELALKSGKKYQTYIGELLHSHIHKRVKAA
ncbi:MAG: hypothetical protein V1913_02510 [Fibrobacterota bacterium]